MDYFYFTLENEYPRRVSEHGKFSHFHIFSTTLND